MVDSTLLKSSKKKNIQPSEKTIENILKFSASLKNVGQTTIGKVVIIQN
jgi:hypothetical protein